MNHLLDHSVLSKALERLELEGYFVWDHFLDLATCEALLFFLKAKQDQNQLRAAGIGNITNHNLDQSIRGDYIYWLSQQEMEESPFMAYFERIEILSNAFRNYFRVAVKGSEFHIACYPKDSFYKKHLDQFQDRNNRLLSLILYLNPYWQVDYGGQLRLYVNKQHIDISPMNARLVLLRSDLIEHEVLTTYNDRYSLTGWLCRNKEELSFLEKS